MAMRYEFPYVPVAYISWLDHLPLNLPKIKSCKKFERQLKIYYFEFKANI